MSNIGDVSHEDMHIFLLYGYLLIKELFYDGSKRGELFFKARRGSIELNARTYRWNREGTKNCLMCRCGDEETIEQYMVEWKAYDDERDVYI